MGLRTNNVLLKKGGNVTENRYNLLDEAWIPIADMGKAGLLRVFGGKGVDSTDSTEAAAPGAIALAQRLNTVVAVSGPEDFITDGTRVIRVANGDEFLTKVTGGGCALGALIAAFAAVRGTNSPVEAVAAAHAVYGIAAEQAAAQAAGPGSFAVSLIDALSTLTPSTISAEQRIREYAA